MEKLRKTVDLGDQKPSYRHVILSFGNIKHNFSIFNNCQIKMRPNIWGLCL